MTLTTIIIIISYNILYIIQNFLGRGGGKRPNPVKDLARTIHVIYMYMYYNTITNNSIRVNIICKIRKQFDKNC